MTEANIADLTVDEFRLLIREVVAQTIVEVLGDPDQGLELREDIKVQLQDSIARVQGGEKTVSAQEVAAKLGLSW